MFRYPWLTFYKNIVRQWYILQKDKIRDKLLGMLSQSKRYTQGELAKELGVKQSAYTKTAQTGFVHKLSLFRQNMEFMDRFMLCAENHTATTLGLGRILKRSGSFPYYNI